MAEYFANRFRLLLPKKSIWLYTGYKVIGVENNIFYLEPNLITNKVFGTENIVKEYKNETKRSEIITKCTVIVDGRYIDSQRNPSKKWAGSDNQRVIDIHQSLEQNKVILYCD